MTLLYSNHVVGSKEAVAAHLARLIRRRMMPSWPAQPSYFVNIKLVVVVVAVVAVATIVVVVVIVIVMIITGQGWSWRHMQSSKSEFKGNKCALYISRWGLREQPNRVKATTSTGSKLPSAASYLTETRRAGMSPDERQHLGREAAAS